MRFLIQRVNHAQVTVANKVVGQIGPGLLVLVGIAHGDTSEIAEKMIAKSINLRIFEDASGKMNLSLADLKDSHPDSVSILAVSQFTLYADSRKGRRPSFTDSAPPAKANALMDEIVAIFGLTGIAVQTGVFGAHMQVTLENDGPVTIMMDSAELFPSTI